MFGGNKDLNESQTPTDLRDDTSDGTSVAKSSKKDKKKRKDKSKKNVVQEIKPSDSFQDPEELEKQRILEQRLLRKIELEYPDPSQKVLGQLDIKERKKHYAYSAAG
jgi:hypothetical protein